MVANYCQHCGSELDPDANFCAECGEPVEATDDRGDESFGWSSLDDDRRGTSAWSSSTDRDETSSGTSSGWSTNDTRASGDTTIAAITHLAALCTWVFGPLIVLLVTEDEFAKQNARNALNWQLVLSIYMLISAILVLVFVGVLFMPILGVLDVVFCIVAAVKAFEGEAWTYPLTPDLV